LMMWQADRGVAFQAARRHLFGKPRPSAKCRPGHHESRQFRGFVRLPGPWIRDAISLVGDVAERRINADRTRRLPLLQSHNAAVQCRFRDSRLHGTDPKFPADVDRPIAAPARRRPPRGRGQQRVGCPCFYEFPRDPARLRQQISVLVTPLDHPPRHRCGPLEATVPWLINTASGSAPRGLAASKITPPPCVDIVVSGPSASLRNPARGPWSGPAARLFAIT
jgi:hypothetical protein